MCQMCGIVQYDHSVDAHVQHIIVSCCPKRQLFWLPSLVLMGGSLGKFSTFTV